MIDGMDETSVPSGPASSRQLGGMTRRQVLAGAAATTLVWAAPGIIKLDVALPTAAVSPPPASRDTSRSAVQGRTIERGRAGPGTGPRVDAAAVDPEETLTRTGTDAWKLAGTASLAAAAGSLAVWGPDREPAQNPVPADGPSDDSG